MSWKCTPGNKGFGFAAEERVGNAPSANHLALSAKSLPELTYMLKILCDELAKVGLQLNPARTKFLTVCADRMPRTAVIKGGLVRVLGGDNGKKTEANLQIRGRTGFLHQEQFARAKFYRFMYIFTNKKVAMRRRLETPGCNSHGFVRFDDDVFDSNGLKSCRCSAGKNVAIHCWVATFTW